ncbi:MAG: hypothetical protein HYR76_01400 [Ignavibacteria bacterium]|nr:hypothetical protein [Ignavibacteria bacterium]
MKRVLLMICVVLVVSSSHAQVSKPKEGSNQIDRSVFGLGFSAGLASGFGLSFRHHLPGDVSYQVVGGIIKVDRKLHYNLGVELQYDLVRGESTRFLIAGALGYFYSGEDGKNDLAAPFRIGFGIGGEWKNLESFHVAGEFLFTYFSDGTILPLPQLSAHYYFF